MSQSFSQGKAAWGPFSSHAYGANAVYIPRFGEKEAVEIIAVLTQNYPEFKTHPTLDYWQGYTIGAERFEHNHQMRVLSWKILPEKKYWSFLYLPAAETQPQMLAEFCWSDEGRLQIRLNMENQTDDDREWWLDLYISPTWMESLADGKLLEVEDTQARFNLAGKVWTLVSRGLALESMVETDSSYWVNFHYNIEQPNDPDNPWSMAKKRIRIRTKPISIPAGRTKKCIIDFFPGRRPEKPRKIAWPKFSAIDSQELPYDHLWWQCIHNQHYTSSFHEDRKTLHLIPAPQWGKFFLWDAGFTLLGAVEEDAGFVEAHLGEMPDPDFQGKSVFKNVGSFLPTAIFAWWELYCKTGDENILKRHYDHLRSLVLATYAYPELKPSATHDGLMHPPRNRIGIDDYPPIVYCDNWAFAWEYKKTLPLNKDRKPRIADQPGIVAMIIRFFKSLRLAAYVLGKTDEVAFWSMLIDKSEKALNEKLWNEKQGIYTWRTKVDGELPMHGLDGCYPLLSNSVPQERHERVLAYATDPKGTWTRYGMTVVPRNSEYYRDLGYWNGGIWIPPQWMMWKAFYTLGQMKLARQLADRVMRLWEKNHEANMCCWEQFRVATGKGGGNGVFSGLNGGLLSLARARRRRGRVQFGLDVLVTYSMDKQQRNLEATIQAPFGDTQTGLSAVLQPQTEYQLTVNGKPDKKLTSDAWGYLATTVAVSRQVPTKVTLKPVIRNTPVRKL